MRYDPTIRAWMTLVLLSAVSVLIAAGPEETLNAGMAGALVLLLSWMKARVILSRYLGLWQAPAWLSGFNWALGLYCLLLMALFLVPAVMF